MASLLAQGFAAAPADTSSSLALQASPVAIALTDLSGRIEQLNSAFQRLFGLSPTTSGAGLDVATVCAGCSDLEFLDALARDGRPRQLEVAFRAPSGRTKQLLCNGVRINGEGALPKWLSLSFVELRKTEALNPIGSSGYPENVLIEKLAGMGSWRIVIHTALDLPRNSMQWSRALCAFFNSSPAERERSVQEYLEQIHPDDRTHVLNAMRATSANNVDYVIEYRKNGTSRVVRSRAVSIRAGGSDPTLVLAGIDQDVTQEYQCDQQHRREARFLKSMIESHEHPMYAVDSQLCYVAFNYAFLNTLSALERREVSLGANILSSVSDTVRRRQVAENLRRGLKGEQRVEDVCIQDRAHAGFRREIVYSPMRGPAHEVIGVAVFSRDLADVSNEKGRVRAKLASSARIQTALSGGCANRRAQMRTDHE